MLILERKNQHMAIKFEKITRMQRSFNIYCYNHFIFIAIYTQKKKLSQYKIYVFS